MTMPEKFKLSCVLFDLDGTLVDTAPELIASLNGALRKFSLPPAAEPLIKPYISFGAAAMIENSVAPETAPELKDQLLESMLNLYETQFAKRSQLVQGMHNTLEYIESRKLKWGIITNKRKRFTMPLVKSLQLDHRASCVVSGDSTPYFKPHPAPMYSGCKNAGVNADECLYIGDAAHDICAGNQANMKTMAALYGYINAVDNPQQWGADVLIQQPADINQWINLNTCH